MTAKQLKEVINFANKNKMRITHIRVGYFNHIVTIGRKSFTDHVQAISKLETLFTRRQQTA